MSDICACCGHLVRCLICHDGHCPGYVFDCFSQGYLDPDSDYWTKPRGQCVCQKLVLYPEELADIEAWSVNSLDEQTIKDILRGWGL